MMAEQKKLPVGIDSFEKIRTEGFYYVDKTGLIKELLDNWTEVSLFTRPRRFGKTLNMQMLRKFFEVGTDRHLFDGLKISEEKALCERYMGQFPVLMLSLKGTEGRSFAEASESLGRLIQAEARRLQFLTESTRLTKIDKEALRGLYGAGLDAEGKRSGLKLLSEMLYKHYGKKTIILIDEYDVPLDKAYENGYYEEMTVFLLSLLGEALKSNDYLQFAVLTGCLRISKESIFSGLNHFSVHTITDASYDEYFGFTDGEVRALLESYGMSGKYEEVREWYDGYRFGRENVYCPWDVICYVKEHLSDPDAFPQMYWANTSGNAIIRRFIGQAARSTREEIERLLAGESVEKPVRQELTYKELYDSVDNLWSILFTTGYLTTKRKIDARLFELTIPNREVHEIFVAQVQEWFEESVARGKPGRLKEFTKALKRGEARTVQELFNTYLKETISIRDSFSRKEKKENFYHGILLGLLGSEEEWLVRSNAEAGEGFCDILVETDDAIGCIIEVKYAGERDFDSACRKALEQIEEKRYAEELAGNGLTTIYLYGIACYKKACRVVCTRMSAQGLDKPFEIQ